MTDTELGHMNDETLAFAARAGDHLAFAELYRRYRPVLAAYAERRLRGEGADVVQSVFISIFRGLGRYRGPRFFSWAYRICVNSVRDELRKRRVRARVTAPGREVPSPDRIASAMGNPEEALIARQLCRQMSRDLEMLPDSHRTVFLLARVQGLEYTEISELLGIPVGTVKSRMYKAVKTLFGPGEPS